ncbi:ribonuclease H-like domain-containing protein [Tanacetum coccineum]|uniref:Ribonuclease H-like domain-containing protein n=1 Tax=Tanacetum coccineum TaxID=301880 RepID=A0ABQ4WCI4_9ASTR
MVPLLSDTIWLVQNGCSFHGLRSEDPNQHLKDFLKLLDSLDLDVANRKRTRLCLFQFSLHDQASNWLERLLAGFISIWEDLTTHFLSQFFPSRRTSKLRNEILMYTQIDINHAAGGNLKGLSAEEAWETIEDCAQCNKQWKNPTSDQTITNLKDHLVGNEVVRVNIPKCMSWLEADDEHIGDLDMMEDKVDNPSPQCTPQVLSSFEVYPPLVTYPKEVEETLGTPMEVEPLEETQLEDLGLNTCNHDIPLSFREVPIFDEPGPQPQPLTNFPSLEASLGNERGSEPPNKPYSPDGFRMKEVDHLTIHTPPSPHMASFYPKDVYCYYHPCVEDPKKHYGFKPSLLGHSGSLGVDFSNFEMIEDDWRLESKEVSFLREGLNLPIWPKELEKGRKVYLLEDKKTPSVMIFDEVSFYTLFQVRGDGVAGIKRRRRDLYGDGVRNFATALGLGRIKEDLEPSTWRRRRDF